MACRQCQRCGARWIDGQLYWATGKPGSDLDLAGLVCNLANDPNCANPLKGATGGDSWEKRAGRAEAFIEALGQEIDRASER
jgi:hypothetical protein